MLADACFNSILPAVASRRRVLFEACAAFLAAHALASRVELATEMTFVKSSRRRHQEIRSTCSKLTSGSDVPAVPCI